MNNKAQALIESGPVIFSDSLAKFYADDKEKREKYAQQLSENIDRDLEIRKKESPIALLQDVAKFTSSVSNLAEARKQAKAKREIEENQQIDAAATLADEGFLSDLNEKQALEYKIKKNNLLEDSPESKQLKILLDKLSAKGQKEAHYELLNYSGRKQVYLNELLARNANQGHTQASMLNDKHFQEKYQSQWAGSTEADKAAIFKNYRIDKLAHLNLSNETLASVISPEFRRQSSTFKGKAQANLFETITTAKDLEVDTILDSAKNVGDLQAGIFDVRNKLLHEETGEGARFADKKAEGGLTSAQQIDEYIVGSLGRLALDGDITVDELQPYIQKGIFHPAGKGKEGATTVEEILLNQGQVNDLIEKATIGQSRRLGVLTSRDNNALAALKIRALKGENVEKELQKIEQRNLVDEKDIKNVRNTKVQDNTPEAYAAEKNDWKGRLNSGNLAKHKELAKTIKNEQLKKEVEGRIDHHIERQTELGYPKDDEQFVRDRIIQAFDLTLKDDEELSGKLYDLQVHLVQKLRKGFQQQIETPDGQPIIDPHGWTITNDNFEQYIVNNGINGGKVEGAPIGIFTATDQGKLERFRSFQKERIDAIREHRKESQLSDTTISEYDKKIAEEYSIAKASPLNTPLKEQVLNKSESILDRNDILGFFSQSKLTPEIMYKARRLGIPPSTLIRKQLEALVKADKEFAKIHQLDQIKFPPGPDEQIYDVLQSDPTLRYLFTRTELSPNQNQRLLQRFNAKYSHFDQGQGVQKYEQERYKGSAPSLPTDYKEQEKQQFEESQKFQDKKRLQDQGLIPIDQKEEENPTIS